MVVERLITKLRLTKEEAGIYSTTQINGPNIIWLEWEKPDIVIAEFVGTPLQIAEEQRRNLSQMKDFVLNRFKGRVIDANLGTHYLSPKRALSVRAIMNHPLVSGNGVPSEIKRAAEASKEVQEIGLTRAQVDHIKKTTKQEIPVKDVRRRERGFTTTTPEGQQIKTREGTEDVYMVDQVLLTSG